MLGILSLVLAQIAIASDGYVLKEGEGFQFLNGITEKVSPETGAERSILAEQVFPKGATTSLHIHDQGDEIFYVARGTGIAHLDGTDYPVAPGDVVFIPRGAIHEMSNPHNDEHLVVVFFMDEPHLFDQFRAIKKRFEQRPNDPLTQEDREYFESFGGSRRVTE
jgi:quercetin dioxygenase-like cupin family protein